MTTTIVQQKPTGSSFTRPKMMENRAFDYIYDKNYHLSTQTDHSLQAMKARSGNSNIHLLPIYQTMFSELKHHPRFTFQLKNNLVLPNHVNQDWPGKQTYTREKQILHKLMTGDHSIQIPRVNFDRTDVDGQDRYKFSRKPIIPFLNAIPPYVVLDTFRNQELEQQRQHELNRPQTSFAKTIGTQTDYRDGEAQTDPYTPEYVVKPGTQPELLTLITLANGRGLPVGLAEVEMIERARAKRAWEATLPPINDPSQWEKRLKMMTEMERKEWMYREKEIEEIQNLRMEMLKKMLKDREENQASILAKKLDKLWVKKQKEKDAKIKKLRAENIKNIRKLIKKRENPEGEFKRRNIIDEYSNFESQAYAPLTRVGYFPDKNADNYVVKNKYLDTYQGLLELEASLPPYVLNLKIDAPKRIQHTKDGYLKRKYREEKRLEEIHSNITSMKEHQKSEEKPLRFLKLIEKPVPRPPTPRINIPDLEEEERELAAIYLQKIIRGKAIQNMMYDGKQEKLVLIKEVASTHALQTVDQANTKLYKQKVLALQRQRHLKTQADDLMDEVLQGLEGEAVSDMLDFLSKELIRLQEERRIHAFAMLAERQRRMREAEESGLRQVEERRRREDDEIFKQMLKTQQDCVDTYLEDCILETVDKVADEESRKEIHDMAVKINDIAYEIENTRSALESEEIVAELVHGFLIPEAQKEFYFPFQVKSKQEPYLMAAHREIYAETNKVLSNDNDSEPAEN
ncbi:unnamed protein product [Brachionus calyciflorus]|uniref:Cilia- and flagella-associated protein 91 n=1 Tax=Brachionus calyciflorus TaxID=104777 RepID=A0A813RSF8_9BILA|nr:unnamed protein product [Brachionus calyciflorus]